MLIKNILEFIHVKYAKWILFSLVVLFCIPVKGQKAGKSSYVDTFKLADKFISKKKFRKAGRLYTIYSHNHPEDVNALWKLGQVKLWQNKNRQSDNAYRQALLLDPNNDNLNLNYIHSLLDMGKLGEAGTRLTNMELAGKDYPNMSFLRAKLNYYKGDFNDAAAYIRKDLSTGSSDPGSQPLSDMIEFARSPLVSVQAAYLTDNQPLSAIISTVKAEKYFSRYATPYIVADEYHFFDNKTGDAPWIRIGNKMYFSEAGLHLNAGVGIVKFPIKSNIGWSGSLAVNKRISAYFDGDISLDHIPYMDTKTSVDSNVSATRVAAMLNWHMNSWSAQAAFLNSTYGDGQSVYGAYAWLMVPVVQFNVGKLLAGYSTSYSNSTESSYKAVLSLPEIIAGYAVHPNIDGLYNPYFSPNNLFINSALVSLMINPSKSVNINLSGDVGYGTIRNPYLYIDKDNSGNDVIKRDFTNENFIPVNASAAFNFNLGKTWMISAKYMYHSTFFFNSHYASLGLQKSFQNRSKARTISNSSTFSRLIQETENKLKDLYNVKTPEELKSRVALIKKDLVTLRDAQKNRKNTTEHLAGSDEEQMLQERYDNLDEMIQELDTIDLNDYEGRGKKDTRQWLVQKLYELTSVSYPSNI